MKKNKQPTNPTPPIDPTLENNGIEDITEEIIITEEPITETIPLEEIAAELTEGMERYPDVFTNYQPDEVQSIEQRGPLFIFSCKNGITLRVEVCNRRVIRFRYSLNGVFGKDFSYALNPDFTPLNTLIETEDGKDQYLIMTPLVTCSIGKADLKVSLRNRDGQLILEEKNGFHAKTTILRGLVEVATGVTAHATESYFGLGDKAWTPNLRGQTYSNWCTDAFAFNDTTKETYRAVPFFYGLNEGRAYGIFLDNTYRTHFDFDSETTGETTYGAEGGELNYYFIYGPELDTVAKEYHQLTGTPELPPMWSLGFHQCRWSYYPESRVREIAKEFRERKIPCDAIYLDIDYMDGFRCFTWDNNHFPNPTKMIADLKQDGFNTVVMIDPGLKLDPDYHVYKDGLEKDVFCRRPDGDIMVGPVWPDNCVFPDYTNPKVRAWWAPLYQELYNENGVAGFWNDMNEPAVFNILKKTFPDDIRHDYDGQACSHAKAHNIYGFNMARATFDGLKALQPDTRPFVLTRSTFAGGQRHAAAWTGDNVASWEHLQYANWQSQRMSISGFSFIGSDIGGFVDEPTGELMTRWLQLGIFHPFYRIHSMGNNVDGGASIDEEAVKASERENRLDQEPWVQGEKYTILNKAAIELRYRLLPYLYTAFRNYVQLGEPILRPLAFAAQNDNKAIAAKRDFLYGRQILVSPVVKKRKKKQNVYLPAGTWYDFHSEEKYLGEQTIRVATPLEKIPFFIKGGSVLPLYPVRQHTGEPVKDLELQVFYQAGETVSQLYEDAGNGYDYKQGAYRLRTFINLGDNNSLSLQQSVEGDYQVAYADCIIRLIGLPSNPKRIIVDGVDVTFEEKPNGAIVLMVKEAFEVINVVL